jgi:hypothetical protein
MKVLKHVWVLVTVVLLAACPVAVEKGGASEPAVAGGYVTTFRQDGAYFRGSDSALEWKYFPDSRRFA